MPNFRLMTSSLVKQLRRGAGFGMGSSDSRCLDRSAASGDYGAGHMAIVIACDNWSGAVEMGTKKKYGIGWILAIQFAGHSRRTRLDKPNF
jgi:hypothetical protein